MKKIRPELIYKNNYNLVVISTSILIIFIMVLSYVQLMVKRSETKFSLSNNYTQVEKVTDDKTSFFQIEEILKSKDILLLSEFKDKSYLGIYDPALLYPPHNFYNILGTYRYFSEEDYINGTKTAIIIDDLITSSDHFDSKLCKEKINERIDEVIYCSDSNNLLSNYGEYIEIINLASLEHLGDILYLDYRNVEGQKESQAIINDLSDYGYLAVSTKLKLGNIISKIPLTSFSLTIIMLSLILYVLYFVMAYWFFYNNKNSIKIYHNHGGTNFSIANKFRVDKIKIYPLVVLFCLSFIYFQYKHNLIVMDYFAVMFIAFSHVILIECINYLPILMNYKKIVRGSKYA